MYRNIDQGKAEHELRREWTCTDSLCLRNIRKKDHTGDNQQNADGLLCKLNLCQYKIGYFEPLLDADCLEENHFGGHSLVAQALYKNDFAL